uniref:Uncharacterized protein n=1 Tax=Setaria italica TaxID=4555 RepID=K3Z1F7_SETIT
MRLSRKMEYLNCAPASRSARGPPAAVAIICRSCHGGADAYGGRGAAQVRPAAPA